MAIRSNACALAIIISICCAGCERELVPTRRTPDVDWREVQGPLMRTRWAQGGAYATFTPSHELLGCWSVAFAQVLAYHRLSPHGVVTYKTSNGLTVSDTLSSNVDWLLLADSLGLHTPEASINEIARYCYAAALVMQKDFGRGEYIDLPGVPVRVSKHYRCLVERLDVERCDMTSILSSELYARRPIVVYFDDILDINVVRNGHTAVIDGSAWHGDQMMVHLELGWGGGSDGWYELSTIARERNLRYLFRVVPNFATSGKE